MSSELVSVQQQILESTELLGPQQTLDEQLHKFERYAAEMFIALGIDPSMPSFKDIPQRFVRALFDTTRGFESGPHALRVLSTQCQSGLACHETHVAEGPIHFFGLCECHSFPLFGHAYVGYVAHEQIMGICKLTRLVRFLTMRFVGRETIRQQIADALQTLIHPLGVAVYLEVDHDCARTHGIRSSVPRAIVWRGEYSLDPALQAEFLSACGLEH